MSSDPSGYWADGGLSRSSGCGSTGGYGETTGANMAIAHSTRMMDPPNHVVRFRSMARRNRAARQRSVCSPAKRSIVATLASTAAGRPSSADSCRRAIGVTPARRCS